MILVYVAGPFSAQTREGVEANIARAVALGVEVARLGLWPVIPHSNTSHPDFETLQPYQFWIDATLALLRRCDAAIFTPDWERSSGARGEHADAVRRQQPVFFDVESLREWAFVARHRSPLDRVPDSATLGRGTVSSPEHEQP